MNENIPPGLVPGATGTAVARFPRIGVPGNRWGRLAPENILK